MVKEDVKIDLTDKGVNVHATFSFKNHGSATVVKMGFPDESTVNVGGNTIQKFESTVDGKPVKVQKVRVKSDSGYEFASAWVKTVPFEKDQERTVVVDYFAVHGVSEFGIVFDTYTLETGSTWYGNIQEGVVSVDWSKMHKYSAPDLYLIEDHSHPSGAKVSRLGPTKGELRFRNLKPKFNLSIGGIVGFWSIKMNGLEMNPMCGLPEDIERPSLTGPHNDLLIRVNALGKFFGTVPFHECQPWASPEAQVFGRHLVVVDKNTIKTGKGKKLHLTRPIVGKGKDQKIRLKDLIESLGGTHSYDPNLDLVKLTLPKK